MTIHNCPIKPTVFDLFERGKKLEIRASSPWAESVKVGDHILFTKNGRRFSTKRSVKFIRCYDTFQAMLDVENLKDIAPGYERAQILAGLSAIYRRKPKKVVVFELELVTG